MSLPNSNRPHVVVVALQGWGVRNSLYSGYLNRISENCQVTLVAKRDIIPDEISDFAPHVNVVGLPTELENYSSSGLHRLVHRYMYLDHDLRVRKNNSTYDAKLENDLIRPRPSGITGLACSLATAPLKFLAVRRWVAKIEDTATEKSDHGRRWASLFGELKPDVVHLPSILFANEAAVASVARRCKIPVCGAVLSWDNLSSKAPFPGPFAASFVWSEHMKEELLQTNPATVGNPVTVTGPLQFDWHRSESWKQDRVDFCESLGLQSDRPILLHAMCAPRQAPQEFEVVQRLSNESTSGSLAEFNPQIVARLHPKCSEESIAVLSKLPNVTVNHPNPSGDLYRWQPTSKDIRLWVNLIHHSSVVSNIFSTATLDAIVHDRPVINFAWSPDPLNPWPGTLARTYTHFKPVVESGATPVVEKLESGCDQIAAYLRDPSLHQQQRRNVAQWICGPSDGRAYDRTALAIETLLNGLGYDVPTT